MPERKLRVFLCHSSQDKSIVRELYQRLLAEKWIDPWLDEEKLLPGQDWDLEIEKAVESSDAVIVFLSKGSVSKEGYVQKELRKVLDIALEKPEETIFIIPVRLEDCELPRRLRARHYVDYFPAEKEEQAYQRLLQALNVRFGQLNPQKEESRLKKDEPKPPKVNISNSLVDLVSAKGNGTVDTAGTIPLILYFSLAALFVLTPSDSTVQFMVGVFAVLTGVFLIFRRQIPPVLIFKISTILFLVMHVLNYTTEIPYGEILEGVAALISCGLAIMTVRAPKKPLLYSSISLASFLLVLGVKEMIGAFGNPPSFLFVPMTILSVITIVFMVMDL
jgi:hypothetical protein